VKESGRSILTWRKLGYIRPVRKQELTEGVYRNRIRGIQEEGGGKLRTTGAKAIAFH
jgi:hypothetical protein